MAFYCKEEHFVNINASDIIIIALIVVAALLAGAYYLNKKTMRRMIQAQDFIIYSDIDTIDITGQKINCQCKIMSA